MLPLGQLVDGPPPGVDPSICEREPIHIPGAIQPHGALLAILADSRVVTHASANLLSILGRSPEAALGQLLEHVIGDAAWRILSSATLDQEFVVEHQATPNAPVLQFHSFKTGRHIGIDIQPMPPEPVLTSPMPAVRSLLEAFEHAASRAELCQLATAGLQDVTGYDRVMVYRFGEQGHGEVVAEVHAPHLEPYLGHHYPTTDIPPQAKRLYLQQRVGSVADSSYQPVPILTNIDLDGGVQLDLTNSTLRSVSPIHCEFMRNMGARASLSIGLVSGSSLWGFILCHHAVPRIAGPDLRAAVDMIGRVVSLLLVSLGEAELYAARNARSATLRALVSRLAVPLPLPAALTEAKAEVLHLLNATGAVIRLDGSLLRLGVTPPALVTEQALAVMQSRASGKLLAVDDLALMHPELAGCSEAGSGALLMPLSDDGENLILWFRPELSRIVTWAGDPNQHAKQDPITGKISPRASFAAWRQTVSGRAKPWTDADLVLAAEMRRIVEEEVARRAKSELAWLRHYQELSDSLEIKVSQRTKALEAETTERLKVEATLQQVQKMEAIGQLTGGVAHDFNNVLAAVIGNLELAEVASAEPNVIQLLGKAQRAAERGARLTDHLLSFARKQPLSRQTCDINQLINQFHGLIARTIGSAVAIQLDLSDGLWPVIADPVQFEMALLNIAVNARDAMPSGGVISITTANIGMASEDLPSDLLRGDYTRISIRDTGVGMNDDLIRRVFEPFFTTKKIGEGTGLGLSQVYGFCKQIGGSVTLSSEVGAGTCINLFLPRTLALSPLLSVSGSTIALREPINTADECCVLVIDDDPDVLQSTTGMLQVLGFKVVTAESGVRGMEILVGDTHVDIVVTDFLMPVMSGLEFIRRARTSKPGLPCLLMSGFADVDGFVEAAAEKISVLRKPYKMKELAFNIAILRKSAGLDGQPALIH